MLAINGREYAILIAVVASLVGLSVLRGRGRAAATRQRTEIFPQMGFVESTRDQVFGDKLRAIETAIDGTGLGRLSHWVGKGASSLGETLIFDVKNLAGPSPQGTSYTVIGFRVGGPPPFFSIAYRDGVERLVEGAVGGGAGVTPAGDPLFDVPLISAEKSDLAQHFRVLASDPDAMRRALTSAFVDALGRVDGRKLHISKWGTEWLFFYRDAIRPLSPQAYPALLSEAVDLLRLLDLRAASQ